MKNALLYLAYPILFIRNIGHTLTTAHYNTLYEARNLTNRKHRALPKNTFKPAPTPVKYQPPRYRPNTFRNSL